MQMNKQRGREDLTTEERSRTEKLTKRKIPIERKINYVRIYTVYCSIIGKWFNTHVQTILNKNPMEITMEVRSLLIIKIAFPFISSLNVSTKLVSMTSLLPSL